MGKFLKFDVRVNQVETYSISIEDLEAIIIKNDLDINITDDLSDEALDTIYAFIGNDEYLDDTGERESTIEYEDYEIFETLEVD